MPPRKRAGAAAAAEPADGSPSKGAAAQLSGWSRDARRGGAGDAAASPAAAPASGEQPSKKRRRGRLGAKAGGGTTSAAAAADDDDTAEDGAGGEAGSPAGLEGPWPHAEGRGGGGSEEEDEDGGGGGRGPRDNDQLMDAVVKVFCTHSEPNFSLPWQRKRQFASSGSGFVIAGRRILTNAHCVDHHTQVKVKRRGSDAKYVAAVLAVGPECDIAMLTVEDPGFWEGLTPVTFGGLPRLQDSVTVIGYPIGGDTMSVTSGVVSRIEVTSYAHGAAELLGVQVDAAINSGNSGGPAFNAAGRCVGIAFQSLKHEDAENISYIIPTPVITHFTSDYERSGRYTGFPALGVEWQKMESPVLRQSLGMEPGQRGVLVRRIEPTAAVSSVLAQGDVLLAFDGVDIGSDGTVPFRSGERIGFSYLISQKYTGDTATLRILHDRQVKEVAVELRGASRLIPIHINNRPPSYYIIGGLVFTAVTVPLLRSEYGKEYDFDAPVKLLDKMMHAMADAPGQQVVVLSQVLAADVNVGYEDIVNTQVLAVNGVKVANLAELVGAVEGTPGAGGAKAKRGGGGSRAKRGGGAAAADGTAAGGRRYLRFDLEYSQVVVLDAEEAGRVRDDILTQHCIAADRSPDLVAA